MSQYNNSAKIFTGSTGGELRISLNNTKQSINATNNKAQYYAELAEKYKNEAKEHRDNAQYYAEQNSDVTFEYIDSIKESLENQIATKQDNGDYALKSELPTNVSELNNDLEFTTFNAVIPNQAGNENKVLCTNGESLFWKIDSSYNLFDTKLFDYVLNEEQSKGWALQGTYVYKEAIAGTRYGYPDFYNKVLEEKESATATEVTLGENTITIYVNPNGHQFYDIADKAIIDFWFETYGTAWYYGIDQENERIYLPRNNYFEQTTGDVSEVGLSVEAGLPNITGEHNISGSRGILASSSAVLGCFVQGSQLGKGSYGNGSDNPAMNHIGFDASKSNDIYGNSDTVQPNAVKKLLYICVGNTTSYEGVINVVNQGLEILEQVNQGIESRVRLDGSNAEFVHIIEIYQNGTSWYRVWSDGWCEQGGVVSVASNATGTITLLKGFKSAIYNCVFTIQSTETTVNSSGVGPVWVTNKNATSITFINDTWAGSLIWEAKGYIV